MIFFPAIDIRGGRCVRLEQGDFTKERVHGDDPVEVARRWEKEGAQWLHVVDLDGARDGAPANRDLIRRLVGAVKIPVQLGGGIRDVAAARAYFEAGVQRIVLGSVLVKNPAEAVRILEAFRGKAALGVDARAGAVAIDGWKTITERTAVDLIGQYVPWNPAAVVYTDIGRDGMMKGPNITETRRLARACGLPVILSGGVSSLADVQAARELEAHGVIGVISGSAIYTGSLRVPEAIATLK